jgi:hypothetical protein
MSDNPGMNSQPGRPPMPGKPAEAPRVNVYIDGYNFYVPLSTMEERQYELSWCDFLALAGGLTKRLAAEHPTEFGTCRLGSVKYFTATIPENMPKNRGGIERKYSWLDALHYHTGGRVEVIHGTFRPRKHRFYIAFKAAPLDEYRVIHLEPMPGVFQVNLCDGGRHKLHLGS